MKRAPLFTTLLLGLVAVVAGCGGGGGSSTGAGGTAATAPGSGVVPAANAQLVPFTISVAVPRDTQTQGIRRSQFISPSTQSITASVVPTGGSQATTSSVSCPPPQTACQIQILAPLGLDTFTLSLYDQANGAGNLLGTGATTLQIVAGDAHFIEVTFNGVPASLQLLIDTPFLVVGTPADGALEVIVRDAGGNVILGPGTYSPAITLSSSDTTGSVTLTLTQLTDARAPETDFHYNGSASISSTVTFTASFPGLAASTVTDAVVPTPPPATPTPAPVPSPTPSYLLKCKYRIQIGSGKFGGQQNCGAQVGVSQSSGAIIDFLLPGVGNEKASLNGIVGGANTWTVGPDGNGGFLVTIAPGNPVGSATLLITDSAGGYREIDIFDF